MAAALVVALVPVPRSSPGQPADRIRVSDERIVVERRGEGDTILVEDRARRRPTRGLVEIDDGADIVRVFADAHVPADRRVAGDVVAVFGSVDVEGEVTGDVVAVMGSVRLREEAVVVGEVVSVGGVVDQADGARVHGETVSVGFLPVSWGLPGLSFTLGAILAGWIAAVFTGWLFAALFPVRLVRVADAASRRTLASLAVGVLSVPGFLALLVLLCVTVVGIPVALLLPPAFVLLAYLGQLAATYVLGCRLTGRRIATDSGLMTPMVVGTLLVAAVFVVGALMVVAPAPMRPVALFACLLGALLVTALTAIGTGAFLLSRLGAEPKDRAPAGEASPPPPHAAVGWG